MRVGLITDTHIPSAASGIPTRVAEVFQGVDLILHAGDLYEASVMDELEKTAPVLVSLGDDDPLSLLEDARVEHEHVLHLEGHTVWLVHEPPWMYSLSSASREEAPEVIVHGHNHDAGVWDSRGVLFVGSGSPTFLNYRRGRGTVGILEIDSAGVRASIVRL